MIHCYILFVAGLSPHPKEKVRFAPTKEEPPTRDVPKTAGAKVSKLSFEDYHQTWCGIATSKSQQDAKNPCMFPTIVTLAFYISVVRTSVFIIVQFN